MAPPCPPPGHCLPLTPSLVSLPPGTLPSLLALIIHALTNPPPMRPDLSPSRQRGLNHSCPPRPEAGWSVDLSVSTTSLTLLNYVEALTNFRPPMLCNPLLAREREPPPVDWLLYHGNANSIGETAVLNVNCANYHGSCCTQGDLNTVEPGALIFTSLIVVAQLVLSW